MASDRGKKQKAEQNAGGSQRSQTRSMRSTKQAKAGAIEQGGELNASLVIEEVTPAEGDAGRQRKQAKSFRSAQWECKQRIIAEMDQIVSGLIEKAKQGGCSQAKLLLIIADKDKDDGKKADRAAQAAADSSLAELLLGELDAAPESAGTAQKRGARRKRAGSSAKAGVAPRSAESAVAV
jgi:hypothetical protein